MHTKRATENAALQVVYIPNESLCNAWSVEKRNASDFASVDPEPSIKGNTVPTIYFKLVILVSYYTFVYYRYSDVCYYYILNDLMMYYCNVKSTPLYGYQATGMMYTHNTHSICAGVPAESTSQTYTCVLTYCKTSTPDQEYTHMYVRTYLKVDRGSWGVMCKKGELLLRFNDGD